MENSKIDFIFPNFFIFIFILASISQKCLKKWVKHFFLRFSFVTYPNFDMENSKIELNFPYFIIVISFLSRLVKNGLQNGPKNIFSDIRENFHIT